MKPKGLFYYNRPWGTLIGYPAGYGSDTELNDHHFHYGYFLFAAAEIARRDPAWAAAGRWGGMVKLLVRDIASAGRRDLGIYLYTAELAAIEQQLAPKDGPSVQEVRRRIRDLMWWDAMICQDENGLNHCLEELEVIGDRDLPRVGARHHSDLFRVLELSNLWQTAQMVATLSKERKETRGPHYRTDYPEPSPAFAGSYLVEATRTPAPGERIAYHLRLVDLTSE